MVSPVTPVVPVEQAPQMTQPQMVSPVVQNTANLMNNNLELQSNNELNASNMFVTGNN